MFLRTVENPQPCAGKITLFLTDNMKRKHTTAAKIAANKISADAKNIMPAVAGAARQSAQPPVLRLPAGPDSRRGTAARSGATIPIAPDTAAPQQPRESAKTAFLRVLPAAGGIAHAVKESGIEPCLLYYCLEHDEAFRREFDAIVNTKLELELIDRTLEGKPAGLFSFTLPARLPHKYDAKYDHPQDNTPPVVIYTPKQPSARKTAK